MDAQRFDAIAKALIAETNRRRTLGGLLSGLLGLFGLAHPDDATAGGKCKPTCGTCQKCKKGKCRKSKHGKKCKKGRCKPLANGMACVGGTCQSGTCTPPPSPPPCVPCGIFGCCPQCCPPLVGTTQPDCATAIDRCCTAAQGGGSCPAEFPQCCPPTAQAPFGSCAEQNGICCPSGAFPSDCPEEFPQCCPMAEQDEPFGHCTEQTSTCCTTAQGGGSCLQGFVCCPVTANFEFGACCPSLAECCNEDADCPGGGVCPDGCCVPPGFVQSESVGFGSTGKSGSGKSGTASFRKSTG